MEPHLLSGLHFVHTSSVTLLVAGFLPDPRWEKPVGLSTLYNLTKTAYDNDGVVVMEIRACDFDSTLLISL